MSSNPKSPRRMMPAERATLALMVIGAERRERLINRYADGLALTYGMRLESARRYAAPFVDEANPYTVLAVGQVWSRPDGKTLPGDAIAELTRREPDESFTVEGFQGGMVAVGRGRHISPHVFQDLWLTAWPSEFAVDGDESPFIGPVPPVEDDTVQSSQGESAGGGGDRFDPHSAWFMVTRTKDGKGLPWGDGLPLLSAPYRAVNWKKPGYTPSYGNALDVVAYIAEHLDDYRAGWHDFIAQRNVRSEWFGYFNEFGDGCECGIELAAYMGHWLWQRVRSDVVAEYGGTVDDYDVLQMWSPGKADVVLAAAPFADPEWDIPADHPMVQCAGQTGLFRVEAA